MVTVGLTLHEMLEDFHTAKWHVCVCVCTKHGPIVHCCLAEKLSYEYMYMYGDDHSMFIRDLECQSTMCIVRIIIVLTGII